ncbi:MAG TPA: glycosyltransferase family 4 protein, partial [Coleofasciculaceae cyanobacterium]
MLKRILMTTDSIGGVWTYTLELVRALHRQGVEVAIATMGVPLTPAQWQEIRQVQPLAVFESQFKLEWMQEPWFDVAQAGAWLLQLEQQLRPDVVHLNGYVHAALAWRSPVLVVAHSCVLSWWQAVKGAAAPAEWQEYRQRVAQGLRSADQVIAPSQAMLDTLYQNYGSAFAGQVIPNGTDPAPFGGADSEAKSESDRGADKLPMILSVGRFWDEAKNLQVLEQIAPDLEVPIFVAGAVQHPQGGRASPSQVRSLGHLPPQDLRSWFAKSAI